MSFKLSDKQRELLRAAAEREDRLLAIPSQLKGAAAQKVAAKLIAASLAKEVKAKAGAPVWRRDAETEQPVKTAENGRDIVSARRGENASATSLGKEARIRPTASQFRMLSQILEFVAADAVLRNQSPRVEFPVYREKNREFIEFRPFSRKFAAEKLRLSVRYAQIPCKSEQGIYFDEQAILFSEHGILDNRTGKGRTGVRVARWSAFFGGRRSALSIPSAFSVLERKAILYFVGWFY